MTLDDAFRDFATDRHSAALRPHLRFAVATPANSNTRWPRASAADPATDGSSSLHGGPNG